MRARKFFLVFFSFSFATLNVWGRDFFVTVDKAGGILSGAGIKRVVRADRGQYEVVFEQAISACDISVDPDNGRTRPARIAAEFRRNSGYSIFVETRSSIGVLVDSRFRIYVNCREPAPPPDPLVGYVDLHTHPLANVGFGGKLLYGGVDQGALLPADPDCNQNVRATSMKQALGHDASTHGPWNPFGNPCGDTIRAGVIFAVEALNDAAPIGPDSTGFPKFPDWPVWNDITHQKMWVDWVERAYQSGLRVMVALAVNNKTLADATAGPCDYPTDDRTSTDLQLAEIKGLVSRHSDFMEIAPTSDDLNRIVRKNKLAVVLGTEIDFFGNLNKVPQPPTNDQIKAEIDRLYSEGVRYMFPIHVLDNPLGGTAAYVDLFNYSTFREMGHYLTLDCATVPQPPDDMSEAINYHFTMNQPWLIPLLNIAGKVKLGTTFPSPPSYHTCSKQLSATQPTFSLDILPNQPNTTFDTITFIIISAEVGVSANDGVTATLNLKDGTSRGPFVLKAQGASAWGAFTVNGGLDQQAMPLTFTLQPAMAAADVSQVVISFAPPASGGTSDQCSIEEVSATLTHSGQLGTDELARSAFGQQNTAGLIETNNNPGDFAISEMMRHGIMIDIDHMSDASKTRVLQLAGAVPGSGYPVNSGHNGLRGFFAQGVPRSQGDVNDRSSTKNQYQLIAKLHGMSGVGSANLDSYQWAQLYIAVLNAMGTNAALAFGTDTDGFAPGMPPRCDPPITSTATTCQNQKSVTMYPFSLNGFTFNQMSIPGTVSTDTRRFWNYDSEGVVHYGMFAEFLNDVLTYPGDGNSSLTGQDVMNNLMTGAEYFYQTWKICESQKRNVP